MSFTACTKCLKAFLKSESLQEICPWCEQVQQEETLELPDTHQNHLFKDTLSVYDIKPESRFLITRDKSDWAQKWLVNFLWAYFVTLKKIIKFPRSYFKVIDCQQSWMSTLVFLYLSYFLSHLFCALWLALFWPEWIFSIPLFILGIVFLILPLLQMALLWVLAVFFHFALMVFGKTQKNFSVTFIVMSYSEGLVLLRSLPVLGPVIYAVYFIMINTQGQSDAHQIALQRVALSFVGFLFLMIFLAVIFFTQLV